MADYNEIHLVIAPDIAQPGNWSVQVAKGFLPESKGRHESVSPTFSRAQLRRLRSRNGWANLDELRQIGSDVWASILSGQIANALQTELFVSNAMTRGLRIRVILVDQDNETVADDGVLISELPVEALYEATHSFLATNTLTPVSRSLQSGQDREPFEVPLPLRVLVVVATPTDKPEANAAQELEVIENGLGALIHPGGPLELEVCQPATRSELARRLANKNYHILHFIGHGGFGIVGDDPSYRPHVSLVKDDGTSDLVDAETLLFMLSNTQVRLLVMTACSSAAASPPDSLDERYAPKAFDGIAQRIIGDAGGNVSAVVAMQFDMESEAAVIFTRALYQNLLHQEKSLDEIVTQARRDISLDARFGAGHRAWVTPAIYWRCKGGKVFNLQALQINLDPHTQARLTALNMLLDKYREFLETLTNQPPQIRQHLSLDINNYRQKIAEVETERTQLMGATVQLRGGTVKPGQEIRCRIFLRLVLPSAVDSVELEIAFPSDKLSFVGEETGGNAANAAIVVAQRPADPDKIRVVVSNTSNNQEWTPEKYEIGILKFKVQAGLNPEILDLKITSFRVTRAGNALPIQALSGVVFIDD